MTFNAGARRAALCAAAIGMAAADTRAQTPTDPSPIVLPELSVTARKREEKPRDVPFGLTAVGRQQLGDGRIAGAQDLFRQVPNFGFNGLNSSRFNYYSIRGIGTLSQPLSPDDTSVVTSVDGVPQPLFASDLSYLDVERVEVLRGPQGTLFGRNTSAGAINIVTRSPTAAPEFTLRGEYGEQNTRLVEGTASGPLVPGKLAGRLAFKYWGADSYVNNTAGRDLGGANNVALRGSLQATPNDDTRITLRLFGEKNRERPSVFSLLQGDRDPAVALTDSRADRRVLGTSLSLSYDMAWATLNATTGFNRLRVDTRTDDTEGLIFSRLFGLPPSFFAPETDISRWRERETTFSQEVRLNAPKDSTIAWVGGVYYFFDHFQARYDNTSAFFTTTNGRRDNDLTTSSLSAFGEVTVPVVDRLKVTAGLRYSRDWKRYEADFTGNGFPGTAASFREKGRMTYGYLTGRVALAYEITADSTVYATVARGYKSGGFPRFNNDAAMGVATAPYRPAKSWTYEIGSKNSLLDGRARLDVALFWTRVRDEQLYATDPVSFTFRPANVDVRSYGIEVEGGVRLAAGVDLTGNLGYTHARLRNVSAALGAVTGARDGNRVPNAPQFGAGVALQYRGEAPWLGLPSDMGVFGRVEYQYQGARYADIGNGLRLDRYHVVNARIGIELARGSVYLFGSNLFDARYQLNGNHYMPGVDAGVAARGRVIGIGGSVRL